MRERGADARRGSPEEWIRLIGRERPQTAEAIRSFVRNTRRFLGRDHGLRTGGPGPRRQPAAAGPRHPLAFLWGLLAAVCNYIPYVGFVISVIPPALLAPPTHNWQFALILVLVYTFVATIIVSVIQPYFVGDAVGISTTMTFVALAFWGWVLGPLGILLAISITLLVKAILIDTDPLGGWARAVVGATPQPVQTPKPA